MFSAPLLDSHTPIAKRVFMTATPKHLDFRKRSKDGDAVVAFSMDDEAIYGPVAYTLPIRHAIKRGLIAGYQVLVSVIDDSMIAATRCARGGDIESLAHAVAIRNAMEAHGIKKIVTFHDSVAEAKQFSENPDIQMALGAQMFHVNGKIPTGERSAILDQFAAAPMGLVTNARCLTEGVDVPAIDMVAFLHPRKSHVDIIQSIGRALRLPSGGTKTTGYILLPLYVSNIEDGGIERALKESGYDTISQVIQALREQDEVVDAAIRAASIQRFDTKEPVNLDFIKVTGPAIHLDFLRKAISTHCIEALGESWDKGYYYAKEFAEREGHAIIPGIYITADGYRTGAWVNTQRMKKDTLSPERKARLEALPRWSWSLRSDQWEVGFLHTEDFAKSEGHTRISLRYKTADGYRTGFWVSTQRRTKDSISPERKARLEALLDWSWDVLSDDWEKGFCYAKEFAEREGHARVPATFKTADGYPLGQWVSNIRTAKDSIPPERKARLEALP
jgi:hypothetical protein